MFSIGRSKVSNRPKDGDLAIGVSLEPINGRREGFVDDLSLLRIEVMGNPLGRVLRSSSKTEEDLANKTFSATAANDTGNKHCNHQTAPGL